MKQTYFLVFSREMWESELFKSVGYSFTKEELDAAEKLDIKLIGNRNGVDCYIQNKFNFQENPNP